MTTDPLEQIRVAPEAAPEPDLTAIRMRARRLDSRRRLTVASIVGTGLTSLVVLAVVLAVQRGPRIPATVEPIPGAVFNPNGSTSPSPGSPAVGDAIARTGDQQTLAAGPGAIKTTGPLRVGIELSSPTVAQGGSVTLRVFACNASAEPVVRSFASGQRYDFEVAHGDNVLWRWGVGRPFTKFGGREIWQPRECRSFAEDWTGVDERNVPLAPGRYAVRANITATDPAPSGVTPVCVGACP